jgi:hypothetical protein
VGAPLGLGAGGMTAAGFGGAGVGALTLTGVTGFGARTGPGLGGGVTIAAAGFAAIGAATGLGAGTGVRAGAGAGTETGFIFEVGGGPNVMRGRRGNAEMRGLEIVSPSGATAAEIFAILAFCAGGCTGAIGRKSATAGSGGPEETTGSTIPSLSSSPKPVVRNVHAVDSVQRIRGEKSIAPCRSSARVPF